MYTLADITGVIRGEEGIFLEVSQTPKSKVFAPVTLSSLIFKYTVPQVPKPNRNNAKLNTFLTFVKKKQKTIAPNTGMYIGAATLENSMEGA